MTMTKPNKILIKATHSYNAKPERIFTALTTPEQARTFMFATFTGKMIKAEVDARVGGHFTFIDRRPDGDASHYGRFVKVEPPKTLAFEFSVQKDSPKADLVTIEIEPLKKGCRVTLTHEADADYEELSDQIQDGWDSILDGLGAALRTP